MTEPFGAKRLVRLLGRPLLTAALAFGLVRWDGPGWAKFLVATAVGLAFGVASRIVAPPREVAAEDRERFSAARTIGNLVHLVILLAFLLALSVSRPGSVGGNVVEFVVWVLVVAGVVGLVREAGVLILVDGPPSKSRKKRR